MFSKDSHIIQLISIFIIHNIFRILILGVDFHSAQFYTPSRHNYSGFLPRYLLLSILTVHIPSPHTRTHGRNLTIFHIISFRYFILESRQEARRHPGWRLKTKVLHPSSLVTITLGRLDKHQVSTGMGEMAIVVQPLPRDLPVSCGSVFYCTIH